MFADPRFLSHRPSVRVLTPSAAAELTGGGDTTLHNHQHNTLSGLNGGGANEIFEPTAFEPTAFEIGSITYYHLTEVEHARATSPTVEGTTVKATDAAGFISSDGSTGFTGTITTASLVGMTVTIKDGIITDIS